MEAKSVVAEGSRVDLDSRSASSWGCMLQHTERDRGDEMMPQSEDK